MAQCFWLSSGELSGPKARHFFMSSALKQAGQNCLWECAFELCLALSMFSAFFSPHDRPLKDSSSCCGIFVGHCERSIFIQWWY